MLVMMKANAPIIVDPSHGTGRREKVIPLSRAAIAVGADGLIIEVHHKPEEALSDGNQSIMPFQLKQLMDEIRQIGAVLGRKVGSVDPNATG